MDHRVVMEIDSLDVSGVFDLLGPAATPLQRVRVSPFESAKVTGEIGSYRFEMRLNDGRRVRGDLTMVKDARIMAEDLIHEYTSGDVYIEAAQEAALKVPEFEAEQEAGLRFPLNVPVGARPADRERGVRLFALAPPEMKAEFFDPFFFDFYAQWIRPGYSFAFRRYSAGDEPSVAVEINSTLNSNALPPLTLIVPPIPVYIEFSAAGIDRPVHSRARASGPLQIMLDILANPAPIDPGLLFSHLFQHIDEAESADRQVYELAFHLASQKFLAPDLAAAAGWYLMRIDRLGAIRDWPRNLADYFTDLPDGSVIEGWRRLEADVANDADSNLPYPNWRIDRPPPATRFNPDPTAQRPDDALTDSALRFTAAAFRGPPRFAMGVRRLAEGLDWCAITLPKEDWPGEMAEARTRAKRWASRLVPGTALATFEGTVDELGFDATLVHEFAPKLP